jgi:sulfotransferase
LVQYESLARSPQDTIASIYEFLGEEPFAHDFGNVVYEADEFDRSAGAPGLHRVAREVRYVERPTILPGEVFKKLDKPLTFWKDASRNIRNVKIV